MSAAPPPSPKSSNVLQDLNSLITKFEDDWDPDLWFTDAKHPDLEVISDNVVKSAPIQLMSSRIRKKIQNKKFGSTEESTLLQSSLLKDGEWLCLKCQFRTREKKVILYHIFSFHHKVILMCSTCPFKTENSKELILHSNQHKNKVTEPLKQSAICQSTDVSKQITQTNTNVFTSLSTQTPAEINTDHGNTVKTRQIGNTKMLGEPSIVFHNRITTTNNIATDQKKYFYKCKWCSVVFSSKSSLQQHFHESHKIKSVISKFNCSQCKFYGFKQEDVTTHFYQVHFNKTHHDLMTRSRLPSVNRQMPVPISKPQPRSYTYKKPHICSICKTEFDSKISMKTHLIMDEGFNQQCSFCKSLFRDKMHLQYHFQRCKKKTILEGLQIKAKPNIEDSATEVIEKTKSFNIGEKKLSLDETCSSLLDILGSTEEESVD